MPNDKRLTVSTPAAVDAGADVAGLVADWQAALELQVRAGELAATSATTYRRGLDKFMTWAGQRGTITDDAIREWKAALLYDGRKPATVNTWLAGVRAFFAWAVGARRLAYNPAAAVKGAGRKGTSQGHKRDTLTDEEVRRVLTAPDPTTGQGKRDRAILSTMAYTAARTSDLQRADLADLRTEGGRLVLHVRGKGRAEADELIVMAHAAASEAMHDWLSARGDAPGPLFTSLSNNNQGGRLSLSAYRGMWGAVKKAAGVRGRTKTLHSLRHTAITNAIRHGATVQKAQAMARHANIQTTMIYYHEQDRLDNPAEDFIRYNGLGDEHR